MTPFVLSFMQVSGQSAEIILGGYFPLDLPQSDKDSMEILKKKCPAVGVRRHIRSFRTANGNFFWTRITSLRPFCAARRMGSYY